MVPLGAFSGGAAGSLLGRHQGLVPSTKGRFESESSAGPRAARPRQTPFPGCLTCEGVLGGGELLPQLAHVVGVHLVVQGAAEPLGLRLVQHRGHRVGHVHHPPGLAGHDEQEAVGRLQDQVLELLRSQTDGHALNCGAKQAEGSKPTPGARFSPPAI